MAETAAGFGAPQRIEPDGNAGVPENYLSLPCKTTHIDTLNSTKDCFLF